MNTVNVSDWNVAEIEAFMTREWPPHDAPFGIHWELCDILLVARRNEEALGAARGWVAGGVGELKQLLVKKGQDRAGVGSLLMKEFESRCRAMGSHKLRLDTAEYQARPFYERHGFACVATLENDRFGKALFIMEKRVETA
ncbi:MAG TPA: GNAT family N-acetyltransferase [Polyangiaceae bacterium]|jgi:GNAT superfamily N-acetyltransferase|nr:GNAT family N-acetyltransferase [Polyangiaceae bacterium]